METIDEARQYISEAFKDVAEIVEKSIGTAGLVSKKLILSDLNELKQKWSDCQIAFFQQQQELKSQREEIKKSFLKISQLESQLIDLTAELRGNKSQ